jgi:hypothetical protein
MSSFCPILKRQWRNLKIMKKPTKNKGSRKALKELGSFTKKQMVAE